MQHELGFATELNEPPFDFDGEYGENYEALAHRLIPGYGSLFQVVAALLDPHLPHGGRALVVGAGTGGEIAGLKNARPDLRIHGIDPSQPMLDLAKARIDQAAAGDGVTLQLGCARDVEEKDFDAATLMNVLHFVPDDGGKEALLRDVCARLRPGGVLAFFDLGGDPGSDDFRRFMAGWELFWKLRGLTEPEADRFRQRIQAGIHFAGEARILELAELAGFTQNVPFYRGFLYRGWLLTRG